jgi:hypothetical protein
VQQTSIAHQDEYALREAADRAASRVVARAANMTGIDYLDFGLERNA